MKFIQYRVTNPLLQTRNKKGKRVKNRIFMFDKVNKTILENHSE